MRKYFKENELIPKSAETDQPVLLGEVMKMPCCMWLFLLISHQKTKNQTNEKAIQTLKVRNKLSQTLFSEYLPNTLSKLIIIALEGAEGEEYKGRWHN